MVALEAPRILLPSGVPFDFDPLLDSPLVGPSVLALVGGSEGSAACNFWRIWSPFDRLQFRGYPAEWGFNENPRTVEFLHRFQAVLLCRLSWVEHDWPSARKWIGLHRAAGRRVWYEADDDLFTPFLIPQQAAGIARGRPREELEAERQASLWAMQQCAGVTVSTPRLATLVRQYTDAPVVVIPNAIDAEWFTAVQRHAPPRSIGGVTVGWAGGNRPDSDLAQMAEAWGRLARRHPHVTFLVIGHQPAVLSRYVPETRVVRVPWRAPQEYPLSLVDVDIACCPLEDRPFNRNKSPIKVFEAGLSGSAVVASPTVYGKVIQDRETGYLANGVDEWDAALSSLVEHADARRATAAALKRDVLAKWSLRRNLWRWPNSWRRLMEEGGD